MNLKNIDELIAKYSRKVGNHHYVRNVHHPYELECMFFKAIHEDNDDDIIRYGLMLAQFQTSDLGQGSKIRSIKNNIIGSCAILTRQAISGGVDENTAFLLSDKYVNFVEEVRSMDELTNLCNMMLLDYIRAIKDSKEYEIYSKPVGKAIRYINEYFSTKITLKTIAEQVKLNDKYLSRIFRQETGITITDYINNKRISYAKYLLIFSNLSILDISVELEYGSAEYFSKLFSKVEGISPKKYRLLYK